MSNSGFSFYGKNFYKDRHARTEYAAQSILGLLLSRTQDIKSSVDVGCGVGTWLNVSRRLGVDRVQGYDGPWVDRGALVIPQESFAELDFNEEIPSSDRFDLVISLEVAEHLPSGKADHFVRQLTKLGDRVLFSAAIPGQGGVGHVNEQWPQYWISKFADHGFVPLDVIRHRIWADTKIPVHYRQNTFLFHKAEDRSSMRLEHEPPIGMPLAIVHPEVYLAAVDPGPPSIAQSLAGLKQSHAALLSAIGRKIARIGQQGVRGRARIV